MTEPTTEDTVMRYLLEQAISEVKAMRADMIPMRAELQRTQQHAAKVVEAITIAYAAIAKTTRLARRVRTLERVAYEGGDVPPMAGPPEKRRPVIPPPSPTEEDSGIWDLPPEAAAIINDVRKSQEREARRDSWFYRTGWNTFFRVAAVIAIAVAMFFGGYIVRHVSFAADAPHQVGPK